MTTARAGPGGRANVTAAPGPAWPARARWLRRARTPAMPAHSPAPAPSAPAASPSRPAATFQSSATTLDAALRSSMTYPLDYMHFSANGL
jgi:hypothetical protein